MIAITTALDATVTPVPGFDLPDKVWETVDRHVPDAVHNGPTWDRNPDWDGEDPLTEFLLPELTLGWQAIKWAEENLLSDDSDEDGNPLPFRFTLEQMRFILWMYAIDERGRFIYREIVLQRLKGWG